MGRLLGQDNTGDPPAAFGAGCLRVNGELHQNTAAKFWSGLVDELASDFPSCTSIVLSTLDATHLCTDLLDPQDVLQRQFEQLSQLDLGQVIQQTVEELELFGPPSNVSVTLYHGSDTIEERCLSLHCMDGNVFAYLVAWLLRWSGISDTMWNERRITGSVCADDIIRELTYSMRFEFRNEHLSEGLYNRDLSLMFERVQLEP